MSEVLVVNPRKKRKTRRRRKPRRKTRTVTKTVYRNKYRRSKPRRRKVRRNPGKSGMKIFGVNLVDTAGGTAIAVGSKALQGTIRQFLPLPATGIGGSLSQLGTGLALSYVADKFLKMKSIARTGAQITIAITMADLFSDLFFGGGMEGLSQLSPYMEGLGQTSPYMEGLAAGVYEPETAEVAEAGGRMQSRF